MGILALTHSLHSFLNLGVLWVSLISGVIWFHSFTPFSIMLLLDIVSLGVPITLQTSPSLELFFLSLLYNYFGFSEVIIFLIVFSINLAPS